MARNISTLLHAYTDGSTFRANPGPISWAVIYVRHGAVEQREGVSRIECGAHQHGTNNRAELMGVIRALELEQEEPLVIFSDSMVTVRCARGEYNRHANLDLWDRFERAMDGRVRRGLYTSFRYVKGHDVNEFNNLADMLAGKHAIANFSLLESVTIVVD